MILVGANYFSIFVATIKSFADKLLLIILPK